MRGEKFSERAEQHPFCGEFFVQLGNSIPPVQRNALPSQLDSFSEHGRGNFFVRISAKLEFVQLERPDVGSHPFFVPGRWPGHCFEAFPGRASQLVDPGRFLAGSEETGETIGIKKRLIDYLSHGWGAGERESEGGFKDRRYRANPSGSSRSDCGKFRRSLNRPSLPSAAESTDSAQRRTPSAVP